MAIQDAVANILIKALHDDELRKKFQEDFEGTLKGLKIEPPLSDEDRKVLEQAFNGSDVAGQCNYPPFDAKF